MVSCCRRAGMYHEGVGVKKDKEEAVRWLRKAAGHGDSASQYNLGMSFMEGDGVTKDVREGLVWIQKAAEQGCPPAVSYMNDIRGGKDQKS